MTQGVRQAARLDAVPAEQSSRPRSTAESSGRLYGGMTAEERAEERRRRYIAAGIDVIGTVGYSRTTQRDIARTSGLAERYFYESFTDLDALLEAVYLQVCADVAARVQAAMEQAPQDLESQIQTGMRVFTEAVLSDPRRARIQLLEAVGVSETVERTRRDVLHAFADIIAAQIRPVAQPDGLDVDLVAMSLVGAINEVLIDVVLGRVTVSVDELVEHFTQIALALGNAVATWTTPTA